MTELVDFLDEVLGSLEMAAMCLAVGGVVWGLFVLRPWRSLGEGASAAAACCTGVLRAGAVGVVFARLSALAAKAWIIFAALGGAPSAAFLRTPLFQASVARVGMAGGLAVAATWLRRRPQSPVRWVTCAFPAALLVATGAWLVHAASRLEGRAELMVLTTLHELGAASWAGGVAQLVVVWQRRRRHPELDALWPVVLRRFSAVGVSAVLLVLATGSALGRAYIGSWRYLVGTGYGAIVIAKVGLLATALALATLNFRAARRWSREGADAALYTRVPFFIEAELALLFALLFAAGALTSLPPAVDTPGEAASWVEVIEFFSPKAPRVTSPSHAAAVASARQDPLAPADENSTPAGAWSEFNHNVAGLFLLCTGLLALLERTRRVPWARHWPLGLLLLAVFLLFRNDPETWPRGSVGFWTSLRDVNVLQHRLAMLLAGTLGLFEWRARSRRAAGSGLPYIFPALGLGGGILLLIHAHSAFEAKSDFLIQMSHTAMGLLAVQVACARWLELRLTPPAGRLAGLGAVLAMLLIGAILAFYRETPVAPVRAAEARPHGVGGHARVRPADLRDR